MISIIWVIIEAAFYLSSFSFLLMSGSAFVLGDWKRDEEVRRYMLIRLAYSMVLILFAIFFALEK